MAALLSAAPIMEEMTVKSKDYEITLDFILQGLRNGNCVLPPPQDEPEPWGHPIKNSIYSCGGYLLAGQEYTLPEWLPRYEVLNQESVHHYTAIRMNTVNYDYDFAEDCDDDEDDCDTDDDDEDDDDGDDSDDEDFEDEYSVDKKDAFVDKGDGENVAASDDDKKYIRDGRGWDDRNNSAKDDDDSGDEGGGKGKDDKCNGKDDEAGGAKDDGDDGGGGDVGHVDGGYDDGNDDGNINGDGRNDDSNADGNIDAGGGNDGGNVDSIINGGGEKNDCNINDSGGNNDGNDNDNVDGGGGNDDGNDNNNVDGGGGNDDGNDNGNVDGGDGNDNGNVDGGGGNDAGNDNGNGGSDDVCNDEGGSASGRNDDSDGAGGDDGGGNDEGADDNKIAAAGNDDENNYSKKDPKTIHNFKDGSVITITAASVAGIDIRKPTSVVALTTDACGDDCDAEKSGDACMTDDDKVTSIQEATATALGGGDTDKQTEGNMTIHENIAIAAADIDARRVEQNTRELQELIDRAMTEFGDLLKKKPVNPLDDTSHGLFGIKGDISDLDISDEKDDDKIDDTNQKDDVDSHALENINGDLQDGSEVASDTAITEKDISQSTTEVVAALAAAHGTCDGDCRTGITGQICMTDDDKATKIQEIVAATALGGGDIDTHTAGNITDDEKMAIAAVDVDDRRVTQTTPDFRELLDHAITEFSSTFETKEPPQQEDDDTAIAVDIADDNSHGLFDIYAEGQSEFQCLQYKPPHKASTTDIDLSFYRLPFTTHDESLMGILSVYAQGQDAFEFCCTASTDSRGKVDDRPKVVEDDDEDEGMFAVFAQF